MGRTLKTVMAAGTALMAMVALPQAAHAQVGVFDSRALDELIEIKDNTFATQEDTDKIQDFHLDKTAKHYDAEIARLDAMIQMMSHRKVNSSGGIVDDAGGANDKRSDIFDKLATSNGKRQDIREIAGKRAADHGLIVGQSGGFSLGNLVGNLLGGGSSVPAEMKDYYKTYGLIDPALIHKGNDTQTLNLLQMHSAMFISDELVQNVAKEADNRHKVYEDLLVLAKQSKDIKTSLEVNNALLIENGRNLATLIDMQTIALNAQSAEMRMGAQQRQQTADLLGVENQGAVNTAVTTLTNSVVSGLAGY